MTNTYKFHPLKKRCKCQVNFTKKDTCTILLCFFIKNAKENGRDQSKVLSVKLPNIFRFTGVAAYTL